MKWEPTSTIARRCQTDDSTVRRWCERGLVICRQLPGKKHGNWRVAIDDDGFPLRPDQHEARTA